MCLYILCVFTSIIGGYLFAQAFAEIFWTKFWLSFVNALQWVDLCVGFAKTTLFAMLIATVSIYSASVAASTWTRWRATPPWRPSGAWCSWGPLTSS